EPDQAGPCDLAGRDQGCAGSGQRSGRRQADVRQVPAVRPARPMSTVAAIDPRHAAGQRLRERLFRSATLLAAILVLALLGAVPSIIYGIWGLFVLAPILQRHVQPWLIEWLGPLPFIGRLFQGPPYGIGVLTASFVLAVMVIPFISAVMRDVFETVPEVLKESAYGLGATTWEVIWQVVVPYARTGVIGGIMLGLGRALGETMAVTFVIGNAHRIGS